MATLVDLTAVKLHLRKGSDTSEDTLIAIYRASAIAWVENYTGHVLVQREVTDTFAEWGEQLTLRHQPITVDDPTPTLTVTYNDLEGDEIEYEERVIRDQRYPWLIVPPYGGEFPTLGDNGAISVVYTAGYDAGEVPDEFNWAILLLAESMNSSDPRGSVAADTAEIVRFILRGFRGAVLA